MVNAGVLVAVATVTMPPVQPTLVTVPGQLTVVQTVLVVFGMVTVTAPLDAGQFTVVRFEPAPKMC
jgi:hypothetical protein